MRGGAKTLRYPASVTHRDPPDETLIRAAPEERATVLASLLAAHRPRLKQMIRMRLHPQVRARVDPSDVVQEACLEASQRVDEFVSDPRVPFVVWLRRLAGQRLLMTHRFHLDAQQRDVRRQAGVHRADMPDASVVSMAQVLTADQTTASAALQREELKAQVARVLERLSDTDREVLCMRHFEGLGNDEVANELGLGKHAASKRYIRALKRLRELIGPSEDRPTEDVPG